MTLDKYIKNYLFGVEFFVAIFNMFDTFVLSDNLVFTLASP